MMGTEVEKCSTLLGDNNVDIINTQYYSSSLKNKHNSVYFHKSIEAVAAGSVRTGNVYGKQNSSNLMRKLLGPMDMYNLNAPFLYKSKDDGTP